jgi:choline dehydrogenase
MNNGWDNPELHGFSAGVALEHPDSRGEICLRSRDPFVAPVIQPNYFAEPRDMQVSVAGLKIAREILCAAAFAGCRGTEWWPGEGTTSDAQWVEHIRRTAQTIYHPVGSCKMSSSRDRDGVVDSQLRVRGADGLRVVDASVFPLETTGHTNAPVVAIAERAADLLSGQQNWPSTES